MSTEILQKSFFISFLASSSELCHYAPTVLPHCFCFSTNMLI
jgi:hypothetical protein